MDKVMQLWRAAVEEPWMVNMLEVGCGVAHYGILTLLHYPQVAYHGSDASAEMIANSLLPPQLVSVVPFERNYFFLPDLLMLSQVLEMLPDPEAELRQALSQMRPRGYMLLHRLRLTVDKPHSIMEPTYCGYPARNYLWNLTQLSLLLEEYGTVHYMERWSGSATVVFQKYA